MFDSPRSPLVLASKTNTRWIPWIHPSPGYKTCLHLSPHHAADHLERDMRPLQYAGRLSHQFVLIQVHSCSLLRSMRDAVQLHHATDWWWL